MAWNTVKRAVAFLLVFAIALGSGPGYIASGQSIYTKASSWAEPEIQAASDNGLLPQLLKGTDMTKPATREELCELAVLVYEKLGNKVLTPASPNPFTDTTNPNILKAYAIGITTGTTATTFSPSQTTTREQVATMFGRAIQGLYPSIDYSNSGQNVFKDQSLIFDYAISHVLFMNKEGIIKGSDDGNFMPRPITLQDEATGYGKTKREEAIAISVRIFNRYSGTPAEPAESNLLKAAESFKAAPLPNLTEKQKFDLIDFDNRVVRPIYEPKITISAAKAITNSGAREFSSAPFAAFVDSEGSQILPIKIQLPSDVVGQTSKIIWQVSKVPFVGLPVGPITKSSRAVVLSGSVPANTTNFNIDFSKIKHSSILAMQSESKVASLILPNIKPNLPVIPTLPVIKPWSIESSIITGENNNTGPVTYYVRAYPVNAAGFSIGDTGSGLPVLYGKPLPEKKSSLPPLVIPSATDFKIKPAQFSGPITTGKENPNTFVDQAEVYMYDVPSKYSFLPVNIPQGIQKLLIQVTLSSPSSTSDSWNNPQGLVYEETYLPDDPVFTSLKNANTLGIAIDFAKFAPSVEKLGGEALTYYVRSVVLSEGNQPGIVHAKYSNAVKLNYGKYNYDGIKYYPQILIDPIIPDIVSVKYQPIKWELSGWIYRYVVIEQPTYADVFGSLAKSITTNPNSLYPGYKVGDKLDFTPKPESKTWWEQAWEAITKFFTDLVNVVMGIVNWVSDTFAKIKAGMINFVLNVLDLPEPFNSLLGTALEALLDYGLMYLGIPPTLPNFNDLANMGVDYLATLALETAGIPAADDLATAALNKAGVPGEFQGYFKDQAEKVGKEMKNEFTNAAKSNPEPNPMNWNFIKYDPEYLYKPGYIIVKIKNPYKVPTPKGSLNFRVDKVMDTTKVGKDVAITDIYAAYHTAHIQVYKPVVGMEIPSLAPGQSIDVPIILEEYIGIPLYNGGPSVIPNMFSKMYHDLGKHNFRITIDYDLPTIAEAKAEQGLTKEGIYSYKTTYSEYNFSVEPYYAR